MTLEAWTVIGVGLTFAAPKFGLFNWLHGDMTAMKEDIGKLGERLGAVEKAQARVAGRLEGPGLTGRAAPALQTGAG